MQLLNEQEIKDALLSHYEECEAEALLDLARKDYELIEAAILKKIGNPVWYHKHWGPDDDIFYDPTDERSPPPKGAEPLYKLPKTKKIADAMDEFLGLE